MHELKPGDWIEVYKTSQTFDGQTTKTWCKATFIREVDGKVIAKTGIRTSAGSYSKWRLVKKEKANDK